MRRQTLYPAILLAVALAGGASLVAVTGDPFDSALGWSYLGGLLVATWWVARAVGRAAWLRTALAVVVPVVGGLVLAVQLSGGGGTGQWFLGLLLLLLVVFAVPAVLVAYLASAPADRSLA